ncbi:adaptin ear-binding coat-associated protein 1 NECAP-1 [Actinidia rufa]|uniref:Adaptin ear-binding coat-associated protein 1 NECAP-1 n=1 Tax=Actinidia rufa TaxID=165716 RepID=A0A7J0FJY2_9ERIC|nr:adaptin ear-binding coat-associated protein 1 NECAP-1 [Actinidia rufa]
MNRVFMMIGELCGGYIGIDELTTTGSKLPMGLDLRERKRWVGPIKFEVPLWKEAGPNVVFRRRGEGGGWSKRKMMVARGRERSVGSRCRWMVDILVVRKAVVGRIGEDKTDWWASAEREWGGAVSNLGVACSPRTEVGRTVQPRQKEEDGGGEVILGRGSPIEVLMRLKILSWKVIHGTCAGGRLRHAFIGIGTWIKRKLQKRWNSSTRILQSVDYSLKDGVTLVLRLKNQTSGQSKFFDQGLNNLSLEEKGDQKMSTIGIKPPPPAPGPLSPAATAVKSPSGTPSNLSLDETCEDKGSGSLKEQSKEPQSSLGNQTAQDVPDDDFGDFQTAG